MKLVKEWLSINVGVFFCFLVILLDIIFILRKKFRIFCNIFDFEINVVIFLWCCCCCLNFLWCLFWSIIFLCWWFWNLIFFWFRFRSLIFFWCCFWSLIRWWYKFWSLFFLWCKFWSWVLLECGRDLLMGLGKMIIVLFGFVVVEFFGDCVFLSELFRGNIDVMFFWVLMICFFFEWLGFKRFNIFFWGFLFFGVDIWSLLLFLVCVIFWCFLIFWVFLIFLFCIILWGLVFFIWYLVILVFSWFICCDGSCILRWVGLFLVVNLLVVGVKGCVGDVVILDL